MYVYMYICICDLEGWEQQQSWYNQGIYMHRCICMFLYMYKYIYIYKHVCIYIYIFIYVYICRLKRCIVQRMYVLMVGAIRLIQRVSRGYAARRAATGICVVIILYLCLIGCSLRFKCNEDRFLLIPTRFVICLSKHHHHRYQKTPGCREDPEYVAHCICFEEIRTILLCLGVLTEYVPR
jgi:hypothetical protein